MHLLREQIWSKLFFKIDLLAGAIEYTDCASA